MRTPFRSFLLAILTAVMATAGAAQARPPRGEPPLAGGAHPPAPGFASGPSGGDALPQPARGRNLQWLNDRGAPAADGPPRMTREERRELRREIHDAGREFYPRRQLR